MYTQQSGQIENALRLGGADDMSAKQMVQGLTNCQQVLEHRSNVDLSKPLNVFFPTILPARNSFSFPTTLKNITVNVPPFKLKEWDPLPYVPMPPWQNVAYPPWPRYGWEELFAGDGANPTPGDTPGGPALRSPSGAVLGPTVIRDARCGPVTAETLSVNRDLHVGGSLTVARHVRVGGDVTIGGDLTVKNNATFDGPVYMAGPVIVGGTPLDPFTFTVVTDVYWDEDALELKKDVKTVQVFGVVQRSLTATVIAGTSCP